MTSKLLLSGLAGALLLAGCSSLSSDKVSVEYYNISGNSTAALDEDIRLKGPRINGGRHAVAVARIKMLPDVKFSAARIQNGIPRCSVTKAKVSVNAKVTLPRWTERKTASAKLGRAWDSIDRYTRLHEATHVDIAFAFAKRMEQGLLNLKNEGSCNDLQLAASLYVQTELKSHDAAQRGFDAREQRRFARLAKARKQKTAKKNASF